LFHILFFLDDELDVRVDLRPLDADDLFIAISARVISSWQYSLPVCRSKEGLPGRFGIYLIKGVVFASVAQRRPQ
jgi:hypothetical protein